MIHRVSPFVFKDNEIESRLNKEAERPLRKLNVINERAINHVHLFLRTDPFSLDRAAREHPTFPSLTSFRCIAVPRKGKPLISIFRRISNEIPSSNARIFEKRYIYFGRKIRFLSTSPRIWRIGTVSMARWLITRVRGGYLGALRDDINRNPARKLREEEKLARGMGERRKATVR